MTREEYLDELEIKTKELMHVYHYEEMYGDWRECCFCNKETNLNKPDEDLAHRAGCFGNEILRQIEFERKTQKARENTCENDCPACEYGDH